MPSDESPQNVASAILLTADLLFSSHAHGAAKQAQVQLAVVPRSEDLFKRIEEGLPALVIVDLQAPGIHLEDLVTKIRVHSQPPTIIAYGPHVHEKLLAAARNAGCDEVLSRGQIHAGLQALLSQYAHGVDHA